MFAHAKAFGCEHLDFDSQGGCFLFEVLKNLQAAVFRAMFASRADEQAISVFAHIVRFLVIEMAL